MFLLQILTSDDLSLASVIGTSRKDFRLMRDMELFARCPLLNVGICNTDVWVWSRSSGLSLATCGCTESITVLGVFFSSPDFGLTITPPLLVPLWVRLLVPLCGRLFVPLFAPLCGRLFDPLCGRLFVPLWGREPGNFFLRWFSSSSLLELLLKKSSSGRAPRASSLDNFLELLDRDSVLDWNTCGNQHTIRINQKH